MDPVLAYPAPAHDDQVSGARALDLNRLFPDPGRHETHGPDKDQAFADILGMEKDLAEKGGDAALVPAVPHPFDDAVQETTGVEFRTQGSGIVPRTDAIAVTAHDQTGAFARAHRVPVNTDDAGDGPAVWFHIGGTVVGFGGDAIIMVLIEPGHPGVVPEDGNHPVLFLLDLKGRGLDAGLEEVVHGPPFPGGKIVIMKKAAEGVMVAMVAAGLGDVFQFHIGRQG
jgi:hypothetical protein